MTKSLIATFDEFMTAVRSAGRCDRPARGDSMTPALRKCLEGIARRSLGPQGWLGAGLDEAVAEWMTCAEKAWAEEAIEILPIGSEVTIPIYENDDDEESVRGYEIGLCEGQSVTVHEYSRDFEGGSSTVVLYTLKDGVLTMDRDYNARDCDGRYSGMSIHEARETRNGHPQWVAVDLEDRDHSAEAAGY